MIHLHTCANIILKGNINMDNVFKALGDKVRLDLFLIINELPEICLCDLETAFSLSSSNLSRHLKELHQANLLEINKVGKWKYYRVSSLGENFIRLIHDLSTPENLQLIKNIVNKIERSTTC